jgi:hypothetical protein
MQLSRETLWFWIQPYTKQTILLAGSRQQFIEKVHSLYVSCTWFDYLNALSAHRALIWTVRACRDCKQSMAGHIELSDGIATTSINQYFYANYFGLKWLYCA